MLLISLNKSFQLLSFLNAKQLFSAIGEVFGTKLVIGVVLSIRLTEDYISVWIKDNNPTTCSKIGFLFFSLFLFFLFSLS